MAFFLLVTMCFNTPIVAEEEENKKTELTTAQWYSKIYVSYRGITAGLLAGVYFAGQIAYKESLPVYAATCVIFATVGSVVGGMAGDALANQWIEKPEENKEPDVLHSLFRDQLNITKENNAPEE